MDDTARKDFLPVGIRSNTNLEELKTQQQRLE